MKMNLLKTMALGILASAAMSGMASATPTIIHITGSTAFRTAVVSAIIAQLNSTGTAEGIGNNANVRKAQSGIYADGTVIWNGSAYTGTANNIVLTNWTGSLAGCVDVSAANSTLTYPDPTNSAIETAVNGQLLTSTTSATSGSSLSSGFATVAAAPDVAMSDSFQSSAAAALAGAKIASGHNIGGATTGPQLSTLVSGAPLVQAGTSSLIVGAGTSAGYLGIVPFEWVLGADDGVNGGIAPFNNITQQTAQYLIKNGFAPFTMFSVNNISGTPNSTGDYVYLIGRNEDSGTRIDAFAEPQLGFTAANKQYRLTFSGGSNTSDIPAPVDFTQIGGSSAKVETMALWPASQQLNTEQYISWSSTGHGGYAGGGDVSSVLGSPVDEANIAGAGPFASQNSGKIFFIGYLGISDAGGYTTTVHDGTTLTYNGVYPSTTAIQQGSYTFWSYEHMYYLSSAYGSATAIGSAQKTFADTLANNLASTYVPYNSSGVADPTVAPTGVLLQPTSSTNGYFTRTVEGGILTLSH